MEDLSRIIHEALGEASTCWSNLEGAGEFQSSRAIEIAERVIKEIRNAIPVNAGGDPIGHLCQFPDGSAKFFKSKKAAQYFADGAYTRCKVVPVYTRPPTNGENDE